MCDLGKYPKESKGEYTGGKLTITASQSIGLGDKVQEIVTGFTGTVCSITTSLYQETQYKVISHAREDGFALENWWPDGRLVVLVKAESGGYVR